MARVIRSFTITCPYCRHAFKGIAAYRTGLIRCSRCNKVFNLK